MFIVIIHGATKYKFLGPWSVRKAIFRTAAIRRSRSHVPSHTEDGRLDVFCFYVQQGLINKNAYQVTRVSIDLRKVLLPSVTASSSHCFLHSFHDSNATTLYSNSRPDSCRHASVIGSYQYLIDNSKGRALTRLFLVKNVVIISVDAWYCVLLRCTIRSNTSEFSTPGFRQGYFTRNPNHSSLYTLPMPAQMSLKQAKAPDSTAGH